MFATLVFVAVPCLFSQTQKRAVFDPGGGLFFVTGKVPKTFASFESIWLSTNDYKPNGKVVPMKPVGELAAGARYKMTRIVYNADEFSFETAAIRGVSYKSSGKLVDDIKYDKSGRAIGTVLTGHLTKRLNGRDVAQADLQFEFEEGG